MEGPGKTRAVINDPSGRQCRLHVRSDSTLEHTLQDVETKANHRPVPRPREKLLTLDLHNWAYNRKRLTGLSSVTL
jgi:hypothetical protein